MSRRTNLNICRCRATPLFLVMVLLGSLVCGQTITPSPYWKNEIVHPNEPFRVVGTSASDPDWVKLTILLAPYDPNIVYFQDSQAYTFHYHFATGLLDPFIGMSPSEYDQVTLYEQGQQAILGAVIMPATGGYPSPPAFPEYGIQFVRQDPYSREEIASLFNVVKASITAEPGVQAFYFPSYEQLATAQANSDWFESQGIPLGSTGLWAEGNALYSEGWALGELKFFTGDQIENAYLAGDLLPGDILLTDGVPAEVPFVAGIISLSPSTPNSHVAILAKTYGVPFVHLALAEDANRAQQLVGHRIVFRAFDEFGGCDVRLIDVEGVLDDATIAEILALKVPPALDISPMASYGAYSAATDGLLPSDIKYFGGKAANFGILRTAIADNSPVAVAFSFDLWNAFLDQTLTGGNTLREQIAARLSSYSYPPSDMEALSAELEGIRDDLFKNTYITRFTQQLRAAVISVLQDPSYGFDENRKIRFRSSTNVEDSNQFTGAGLYDSFSGCLADDLDGDNQGPCICDPNRDNERGVFRAIRKVFASFYNDNAFLERLRHDVNESDVGMALLVHHSFPDEIELANGVATLEKGSGSSRNIMLVTQLGATSVANPQDGSIPEEVNVDVYSFGTYLTLVRSSNLVPLGGTVMEWQDDYIELSQLLVTSAERFGQVTGKTKYVLDFEYKKLAAGGAAMPAGGLVVKQVREIPQPDNTPSITPFLINEPAQYCMFQGGQNVFANHRLKSRWQLETKSLWLTGDNLTDSFYTMATLEYMASARIRTLTGALPLWPFAWHSCKSSSYPDGMDTVDGWLMHHLQNRRSCELQTNNVPILVSPAENPLLTIGDFGYSYNSWLGFHVTYAEPVLSWDWTGPTTTTTDRVALCLCPQPQPGDILQQRSFTGPNGVSISTSFYWPPDPGFSAGYTAPLVRWVETVIEGYTTEPIVLHGWYSQTYHPEHHNFSEHFIFEPQLEPGMSPQILSELRAKNIRLIHMQIAWDYDNEIYVVMHYATDEYVETPFVYGDIDRDEDVDFHDFALLAVRWLDTVCDECGGADLTGDGQVVLDDLREFADNWLAGVE
ncbi:hypothetical protein ES703_43785 [subsurface metagenome]